MGQGEIERGGARREKRAREEREGYRVWEVDTSQRGSGYREVTSPGHSNAAVHEPNNNNLHVFTLCACSLSPLLPHPFLQIVMAGDERPSLLEPSVLQLADDVRIAGLPPVVLTVLPFVLTALTSTVPILTCLVAVGEGQTDFVIDMILKCVCKVLSAVLVCSFLCARCAVLTCFWRQLGSKVPVYGTLVGLVNQDIPDFGKKVLASPPRL